MPTKVFDSRMVTAQTALAELIRKIDELPEPFRQNLLTDTERLENLIVREEALQAEQTEMLKRSEERFRLANRAVTGVVYDWDMVNDYVYRSEGLEQLIGLSPAEISNGHDRWMERIHPDDLTIGRLALQEVLASDGNIFQNKYRVRHKDGHWVHVWDRSYIVRDAAGKPLRLIGYATDVSYLNQSSAALEASEARYREKVAELEAMMDAVPAYVWIARDPDSRFITGNRAAHQVLKMKPGQNLSKTAPEPEVPRHFRTLSEGIEIPPHELPVQMAARGIMVRDYEYELVFDNGETICMIGNATPIFDEDGNPTGSVSAFIDITERRRLEQQYRRFFENIQEAVIIYEAVRDENGRVIDWVYRDANPPGVKITGLPREELLGKLASEVLPTESLPRIAKYARVLESGQPESDEISYKGCHYLVTSFRMDENTVAVSTIDISLRRAAEEKNREYAVQVEIQRRLTEYRERERQELARDIHDGPIQTLVSSIFNLQYIKEAYENPTLKVELDQLGLTLKGAVRELREVINELRPPSLIRFGLVKAIRIHAADYQERHPEITLDLDLEDDARPLDESTALSIFRMYQEGLSNVARHAQASSAWVKFRLQPGEALLEIRDNGKGFVVTNDLAKLTRAGHFGMAGMVERAETIGGEMEISSSPNGGTTVRIRIPVK